MSGYGGNLTYPDNKQFRNSIKTLVVADTPVGKPGQDFYIVTDNGVKTLFIESTGDYIPGGPQATVAKVASKLATAKKTTIMLENRAPFDTSNHELGFILKAVAQHPGVLNDNFYGQFRTYAHKFDYLDPVTGGLISDADLMRAYADICQQISDDTGRYNGHMQGNYEAIVTATQALTFDTTVAGDKFDIPALGVYGAAIADLIPGSTLKVNDYIDITTPTAPTNRPATLPANFVPGYGFVVHAATAKVDTSKGGLVLETKKEYMNEYTHQVQEVDGKFTEVAGNFEVLPWAEVYREFAHMEHMVPLSNFHYDVKPAMPVVTATPPAATDTAWYKYILETNHKVGTFHGASHGGDYKERMVLFVLATAAQITALDTFLADWKS